MTPRQRVEVCSDSGFIYFFVLFTILWGVNNNVKLGDNVSSVMNCFEIACGMLSLCLGMLSGLIYMMRLVTEINDHNNYISNNRIIIQSHTREERTSDNNRSATLGFFPSIDISRMALMILPPFRIFKSNNNNSSSSGNSDDEGVETTVSFAECAICLEEFKDGELVQPFPRCEHEFHASCINSWLRGGKTTCPTCRFCLRDVLMERGNITC